jgi:anti-sigma factor RsiW
MNRDQLAALLASVRANEPGQSPACPDEHQIAGYVDGGLADSARGQVETHLADCTHCLALVGLLCRERDAPAVERLPGSVGARARGDVVELPQRRWRVAPQWAAAAALVLAVPLLLQLGRDPHRGAEGPGSPASSVTRTIAPAADGLQVLSPAAGAAVDVRRLSFHWTEVAGTPFYDVRVVTDAGDVIIQQRVTGTSWRPPASLNLQSGAEYFVHVDAYPSGDKAVSSDHVPFRVEE